MLTVVIKPIVLAKVVICNNWLSVVVFYSYSHGGFTHVREAAVCKDLSIMFPTTLSSVSVPDW